jgi:hypothetical protein
MQIVMDALESQMDPDDTEIQAYARACNRVQGDEDAINARYKAECEKLALAHGKMLKACENRRKGIEWKWGQMIQNLVFQKTQGTKKRFVDTLFGRVGFRKQPAKEVRMFRNGCDKNTALAWAQENCKAAIKTGKESVNIKELPEDCPEIWVEQVPEQDNFYFKAPKPKQESKDAGN